MPLNGVAHHIFGNPLLPPYPAHFHRAVFGNGCETAQTADPLASSRRVPSEPPYQQMLPQRRGERNKHRADWEEGGEQILERSRVGGGPVANTGGEQSERRAEQSDQCRQRLAAREDRPRTSAARLHLAIGPRLFCLL